MIKSGRLGESEGRLAMKGERNSRLGLVSVVLEGTRSDKRVQVSVIAKAAVDRDGQSQTKPTSFRGPFFPSSSRPRPFKSIFSLLPLLPFLLIFLHLPDDRLLHLLPHRRPFLKHKRLCAEWF